MEYRYVEVEGHTMAYVDEGEGDPIVFLHGNPTSSYLWRNVISEVVDVGRCIAPDLIGMGRSDRISNSGPESYRFVEHRRFLDGFLSAVGVEQNVTLVIHDWGSALGFDWARRHADAIAGIVYMEAIVAPVPSWDRWPEQARSIFQSMRSEAGEQMILEKNLFVEAILPASILRDLTEEEMAEYRRPFVEPGESRRPTLTWPREIPIEGSPRDVAEIVGDYSDWLTSSEIPKLFINADPGSILTGELREFCRTWPNQTEITVAGTHFIQEDSPAEIGRAVHNFVVGGR